MGNIINESLTFKVCTKFKEVGLSGESIMDMSFSNLEKFLKKTLLDFDEYIQKASDFNKNIEYYADSFNELEYVFFNILNIQAKERNMLRMLIKETYKQAIVDGIV